MTRTTEITDFVMWVAARLAEHFDIALAVMPVFEAHRPTMAGQTVGRVILGQLIEPVWVCPVCSANEGDGYNGLVEAPCPTLRAIAAGFDDLPGFREEWRP